MASVREIGGPRRARTAALQRGALRSAHKTPEVKAWLARFHVHFTPTDSSWVNQVERWFGLLTDQMIRRGVHKSVQALESDIRKWIEHWNEDPRPFTWPKTAEEILNSLK